jgi:hypothetical protein
VLGSTFSDSIDDPRLKVWYPDVKDGNDVEAAAHARW